MVIHAPKALGKRTIKKPPNKPDMNKPTRNLFKFRELSNPESNVRTREAMKRMDMINPVSTALTETTEVVGVLKKRSMAAQRNPSNKVDLKKVAGVSHEFQTGTVWRRYTLDMLQIAARPHRLVARYNNE
jgi:C1A family cysteine protease